MATTRKRRAIEYEVDARGCHICFSHGCNKDGYPVIKLDRKIQRLSRVIYIRNKGEIPAGYVVRHECDNPKCINADHLITGTHADNVKDRVQRGRSARGVNNGRAKLVETQVQEIRASTASKSSLVRKYGVSRRLILDIINGQVWVHLLP